MRNSKFFKFLKFFLTKFWGGYIFQPNWQQGSWLYCYLLYIGCELTLGQIRKLDFARQGVSLLGAPSPES
jgi:hypothetical protein